MPAEFADMGVRFQYPESWSLSKDAPLVDCRSVTINGPEGAFWTLSIHPRSADPDGLIEAAVQAMREEYEDLENERVVECVHGHELVGEDLNFFCFDLTNTAWIRSLRTREATYAVFCQAEDRQFDEIGDVFRAMTASFLAGLGPPTRDD